MYISTKYFRHFVEGRSFIIYTDHKPLTFALASSSDRSPRQTRNLLLLRNSRVILDTLKEWRTWWRTLCQDQRLLMSLYPLSITLKWQLFKIQLQWRISVFRWSGSLGRVWIYGAILLKQVLDHWCRRNSEYQCCRHDLSGQVSVQTFVGGVVNATLAKLLRWHDTRGLLLQFSLQRNNVLAAYIWILWAHFLLLMIAATS